MRRSRWTSRRVVIWVALIALTAGFALASPAAAGTSKTFTVNSNLDAHDAAPGDGVCDDGASHCTLRAAIEEANATGAPDTVHLSSGMYDLTIGELYIYEPLTIMGGGSGSTFVDGTNTYRVFNVAHSSTSISGITIQHGHPGSGNGGGVNVGQNSVLSLRNVVVRNNAVPSTSGGGVYNAGSLTMTHVVVQSNTATAGGGLDTENATRLSHVQVKDNSAAGEGGGIFADGGTLSVSRSQVSNNSIGNANGIGAGIYSEFTTLSLLQSWVKGNTCPSCEGAGVDNDGVGSITQSTISGNSTGDGIGGGLATDGPTSLTNDTIYGNSAGGDAGGIAAWGYTVLTNVTVTHNETESDGSGGSLGGGVAAFNPGALQFRNSIVGANLFGSTGADPNCFDEEFVGTDVNSLGHNVFGPITGCPSSDFLGSDKKNVSNSSLKLGTFGMHGGPTPTVPVLSGSPALKHGTSCPPIDQRGVKRPKTGCDSGAYERTPA